MVSSEQDFVFEAVKAEHVEMRCLYRTGHWQPQTQWSIFCLCLNAREWAECVIGTGHTVSIGQQLDMIGRCHVTKAEISHV